MSPQKKLVLLSQAVGVLLLAALAPVSPASAQNYRQEDFPKPPSTAADCNAGRHWELVPRARCVCDGDLGHIPVSNDQPAACNQPRPTISVYRNPTSAVTGSGFTVSWTATDSWVVNYVCTGVSPSSGIAGQAPQNGGISASWNGTGARTPMTGGFSGTYGAVGSTSCVWTATGLGGTASTGDSFTVYCPPTPPDTADTVYSQNPVTCDVTSTTIPASPGSTPTGGTSTSTVPVTPAPVPTSSTVTQTCADYGATGSGYITTVNGSVVSAGGTCSVNTPCPAGQTGGPIVTTLDVASGTTSQSGSCTPVTIPNTTPKPQKCDPPPPDTLDSTCGGDPTLTGTITYSYVVDWKTCIANQYVLSNTCKPIQPQTSVGGAGGAACTYPVSSNTVIDAPCPQGWSGMGYAWTVYTPAWDSNCVMYSSEKFTGICTPPRVVVDRPISYVSTYCPAGQTTEQTGLDQIWTTIYSDGTTSTDTMTASFPVCR